MSSTKPKLVISSNVVALLLACALSTAGGAGCASEPKVVPSQGPRQPTTVEQVKIYDKAPQKYEVLGKVTVNRAEGAMWDNRAEANAAFDNARKKAAALGANGLLVHAEPGEFNARVNAGYHGTFGFPTTRDECYERLTELQDEARDIRLRLLEDDDDKQFLWRRLGMIRDYVAEIQRALNEPAD